MVKAWESKKIGFGTLTDFEIRCGRYFAERIMGDPL